MKWQKIKDKKKQIEVVVSSLLRNNIAIIGETVYIGGRPSRKNRNKIEKIKSVVGKNTYGKIDFLKNYCQFTVLEHRDRTAPYKGEYIASIPTHF
jgi:dTDP-D-glucose 4,6-dehydratase